MRRLARVQVCLVRVAEVRAPLQTPRSSFALIATATIPQPVSFLSLRGSASVREAGSPAVVFKTTKGTFTLNLRPDWAPRGV